MTFSYTIYGLRLDSALPLRPLAGTIASGPADVRLVHVDACQLGTLDLEPSEAPGFSERSVLRSDSCDLIWPPDARVRIERGAEILIDYRPEIELAALEAAILGPVMGVLLAQRGLLPLHASAVTCAGTAIAFAGASGEGKSTLAAAWARRGCPLLTDDIAAVAWQGERAFVLPTHARQKLAPDALRVFGLNPADLQAVHSHEEKRWSDVGLVGASQPAPLQALVFLTSGPRLELHTLTAHEAWLEYVRNTFRAELVQPILGAQKHFEWIARLAKEVPAYRWSRPRRLDQLDVALEWLARELRLSLPACTSHGIEH